METVWQEITNNPEFSEYKFTQSPAPVSNHDNILKFRGFCKENTCGCYGTTWGCPPGSCSDEEAAELIDRYQNAIIAQRRFENVDIKDKDLVREISKDFQNLCRRLSAEAKEHGIENLPLGDGGCLYCKKCSYPEPCRFPDKVVMSISGMGIDIGEYLKEQGIQFAFEKNAITLYAIILF